MIDAIYIHIPFCLTKCDYCDFTSFRCNENEKERYVKSLIEEIKMYPKYKYNTIYFGGGTPSLLEIEQIKSILTTLETEKFEEYKENKKEKNKKEENKKEENKKEEDKKEEDKKEKKCEITLEVNPKTMNYEKLVQLKEIGVNRLSIGIQSFDDKYLKILGRAHTAKESIKTYQDARKAGFSNISLDLMFSLPNQTLQEVIEDLNKLIELKPEHFSIYSLIWEEGTVFFEKLKKNILRETENELETEMYDKIIEISKKNSYNHYEISNFSLPDKESKHNTKYWKNSEYLGVGLGASGYLKDGRYKNFSDFKLYYENIDSNKFPVEEKEIIDSKEKELYRNILGFRLLKEGLVPGEIYLDTYTNLLNTGFLMYEKGRYFLTKKGLFLFNDAMSNFL